MPEKIDMIPGALVSMFRIWLQSVQNSVYQALKEAWPLGLLVSVKEEGGVACVPVNSSEKRKKGGGLCNPQSFKRK